MHSKLLGAVPLDPEQTARDVQCILDSPLNDQYSEYALGTWRSYILCNPTGDEKDALYRLEDGRSRITPLGTRVPYVTAVLQRTFDWDRVRWVRALLVQDGVLAPHRDFIELDRTAIRIHLPLQTHITCLHSEEDDVFHMRAGELWYLDATSVHSACSLSKFPRVSICVDFEVDPAEIDSIFRDATVIDGQGTPTRPGREAIDDSFLDGVYGLAELIDEYNFRDVFKVLAKVHFSRACHAAAMYDWMIEICRRSGKAELEEKAVGFRRFCLECRALGETFKM